MKVETDLCSLLLQLSVLFNISTRVASLGALQKRAMFGNGAQRMGPMFGKRRSEIPLFDNTKGNNFPWYVTAAPFYDAGIFSEQTDTDRFPSATRDSRWEKVEPWSKVNRPPWRQAKLPPIYPDQLFATSSPRTNVAGRIKPELEANIRRMLDRNVDVLTDLIQRQLDTDSLRRSPTTTQDDDDGGVSELVRLLRASANSQQDFDTNRAQSNMAPADQPPY